MVVGLLSLIGYFLYSYYAQKTIRLGVYSGSSWDVPNSRDNRAIDQAIALFEKQHPNVNVIYESGIPKEEYAGWLSERIIQGEQADMFIVPEEDFSLLASTGTLEDLSPYLEKEFDTSIYYEAALETGVYGGRQYALPFESNPIMMCVNKDLLAAEGIALPESDWTLEDLYRICKAVTKDTDGNGVIDQYGITDYSWQQALIAHGGQLFDSQDGKLTVANDKMRDALTYLARLTALSGDSTVTSEDFDKGRVAFYPMTLAQYRTYKPYPYHVAKYSTFAWTCIQMPTVQSGMAGTQVETSLFAMSAKTHHPELVWEFLNLLSTDRSIQQELFNHSQGMSVLKSVMASQETRNTLKAEDFGEDSLSAATLHRLMENTVVERKFKYYNHVVERADYLLLKAMKEKNLDSQLPSIQKELEEELE